jgi:hypothetical protein
MSFLRKVVAPVRDPALWEAKNEHIMDLVPVGVYPALRGGVVVTRKRKFGIITIKSKAQCQRIGE